MLSKPVRLAISILYILSLTACSLAPALAPAATQPPIIIKVPITETPVPPTSTLAPTPKPISTPLPTLTAIPSPTLDLAATEQYKMQQEKLQGFSDAGYISTSNGDYIKLPSYSSEWAQIGWYLWDPVGANVTDDFIISTDTTWSSASKTPDPSGCGFVFRVQPNDDHYMMFIGTDGNVYAAHNLNHRWVRMGYGNFGKVNLNGTARVTLIVENNKITVIVNDKLIKTFTGFDGKLTSGYLAYTVVSGTNKSFGTRCTFENTDLWNLANN